jgi:allophanate hydrolase subunit 1
MAKRKTPKADKIVDLKPKAEKITDEQLKRVQETVNNINRIQIELGQLEVRKHELLHSIATVKDGLALIQSEFEKEYGTVDINIQDGTINYPPDNGETNKKD